MEITSLTVGVPVTDLTAAVAWYRRVLELDQPDLEPDDSVVEFDVAGTWLQLWEAGELERAAGEQTTVRIGVTGLARERERIERLGEQPEPMVSIEGLIDFFELRDPDGNAITLYELHEQG